MRWISRDTRPNVPTAGRSRPRSGTTGDAGSRRLRSLRACWSPSRHGQPDWHFENGLLVYTVAYLLKRGYCCGSGCHHCPYEPKHVEGNRKARP